MGAARSSMGIGQLLVVLGLVLVYGVGGYWLVLELLRDPESPWFIQVGVAAIVVGLTILLGVVWTQRLKQARTDKYAEVQD